MRRSILAGVVAMTALSMSALSDTPSLAQSPSTSVGSHVSVGRPPAEIGDLLACPEGSLIATGSIDYGGHPKGNVKPKPATRIELPKSVSIDDLKLAAKNEHQRDYTATRRGTVWFAVGVADIGKAHTWLAITTARCTSISG